MPPTPETTTRPGPWRAVEQRLVHKVAAGEVLVTDLAPVSPGLVAVAARWPAGHRLYDRRAGTVGHLLLVVETIRQAGLCVAHAHLGVPLGEQFIFHRMSVRLAAPVAELAGTEPAGTVTTVEPSPRFRGGRPSGAVLAVEIRHEGRLWASAEADYSWTPRRVYDRLRAAGRAVPPPGAGPLVPHPRGPGYDGRSAGGRTPVAVDLTDPTFFDHELDHLPGMLLIDAALRAAAARAGAPLVGLDVTFDRFAELDRDTWVRTRSVRHAGGPAVDVRLGQGEEPVARARVLAEEGGEPGLRPAARAAAAAGPAPRTRPAAPAGPAGR
ncbi:ScbA/BarX family gamma-butyrolactone biosynthesis protein [Blastococcus xanthinilyticus]|uniref:A-factor biosynthesis hotdog protein n=1 Tax=Blastococcus xanthinilyticus TaxID=1564164 RepID=A0A5S5CTN7_9ACTN|nr:ScbA/BarX family gamma-butyrolactone biosynthesis protein [Blastococcus xanthinilyticus]TYP86206.1 A-factor biosynthesis hotdog protein [Blastococcus xanthinilyticus]